MSRITNMLNEYKTEQRRAIKKPLTGIFIEEDLNEVTFNEGRYGNQTEYVLKLTLGVNFFANPAQYDTAREIAEKAINRELYKGMYDLLYKLRSAVYNEETELALRVINEMENELM